MKVVVLGGYGHYGRYIARKLVEQEVVDRTAGRGVRMLVWLPLPVPLQRAAS